MSWVPIGPDFAFAPIRGGFLRLSRRNEAGRQGLVSAITVDQADPAHLYVAIRPSTGGSAAFRADDGGSTWTPLSDALQQADPSVSPTAFAVNPFSPSTVYLFTDDGRCYVSSSRGDPGSWGTPATLGGYIRYVLVDPNTAGTPATTVLYAAGSDGVWQSTNGGSSWARVLPGDTWSLVGDFSVPGTPKLYAGVYRQGLFFTTTPAGAWTNLSAAGIGLPAYTPPTTALPEGSFNAVMVDRCPANGRLYVLLGQNLQNSGDVVAGLYTTSSPATSWTQVTLPASPPEPSYGFYDWSFAVAPNSPGNGTSDVLFFGGLGVWRSANSGRTWDQSGDDFHADHHAFAFAPDDYNGGAVPDTFVGCDGGIFRSDRWADPAFNFAQTFADFDDQYSYSDTGAPENLNHGLQSVACLGYAADPSVPALSYVGCQDTGLQGGAAALGWRSLEDADGNQVAAALGPNGMSVWNVLGEYNSWPTFQIHHWSDRGNFSSPASAVTMPAAAGSLVAATSNMTTGLDTLCLAGLAARSSQTTLTAPITAPGVQTAHAASLAGVVEGALLVIDTGVAQEAVKATSVTATTFSADFANAHPSGAPVVLQRQCMGRIDHNGQATQISQDFGARGVGWVAASPVDANELYCVTGDQLLWNTTSGSTAGPGTVWTQLPSGLAAGYGISSVTVDQAGDVYVLLWFAVTVGSGELAFTTPLFKAGAGSWTAIACTGEPSAGFGWIVADPAQAGTLYATSGGNVYQVAVTGTAATWTSVSSGLPGGPISQLWAAHVTSSNGDGSAVTLLRASVPTRGVWELSLPDRQSAAPVLYVRDNVRDLGWIDTATDGGADPYSAGGQVWHYQCADIKVDARNPGNGSSGPFFQTDPEGATLPIDHTLFDELNDNSQNLPSGDQAMIHVQVHNRSLSPTTQVRVWAIYCNASAGVPTLSTASFDFWSQFHVTGDIIPALPAGSPWTSVGAPLTLQPVDAAHPQVASWLWTAPTLTGSDPGHYCVMAFVNSAASPLSLTTSSGDAATVQSTQVGQKNLHVGPPLPPSPGPGGGGGGGIPGGRPFSEIIEFHNPETTTRAASLVFDLRQLHPNIRATVFFSPLDTATPLLTAVTGYTKVVTGHVTGSGLLGKLLEEVREIPGELDQIEDAIENRIRSWFGLGHEHDPDDTSDIDLPNGFNTVGWVARRSGILEVRGVTIPAGGQVKALIMVEAAGPLPHGERYQFEVQQAVGGQVVGGSTYVVPVAGRPVIPVSLAPSDDEIVSEAGRFLQPWLVQGWIDREKQQGRR